MLSMESQEMSDWFEEIILEMIKEYKYKDQTSAENIGAINALNELLRKINEE